MPCLTEREHPDDLEEASLQVFVEGVDSDLSSYRFDEEWFHATGFAMWSHVLIIGRAGGVHRTPRAYKTWGSDPHLTRATNWSRTPRECIAGHNGSVEEPNGGCGDTYTGTCGTHEGLRYAGIHLKIELMDTLVFLESGIQTDVLGDPPLFASV